MVDAKKSGALAGRGELTLQLTQVTLGGVSTALVSDVWGRTTGDKAAQAVNSTAVGGVIGALIGAAAGGGRGAAIGAGVGGALGLGSAAASGSGQVFVPSEGLLTFLRERSRSNSGGAIPRCTTGRMGRGTIGLILMAILIPTEAI